MLPVKGNRNNLYTHLQSNLKITSLIKALSCKFGRYKFQTTQGNLIIFIQIMIIPLI
ncbi:hypothetical protein D3C75_596320 [compost metagenome]